MPGGLDMKDLKIGKIELTKERLIVAIPAALTLIALGLYLIFYAPLINRTKT